MIARRHVVLAAVAFANLVVAALHFGLAAAAPVLRDQLGVGEGGLGAVLAAAPAGLMVGTLAWGELADRLDERRVLGIAFAGFAISMGLMALLVKEGGGVLTTCVTLAAAGAFGSAAHSAGGRAISGAFPRERHGLVLSIRHTAIPVGGALGAITLPTMIRDGGLETAALVTAIAGTAAAVGIMLALPDQRLADAAPSPGGQQPVRSPLNDRDLWLLGLGCASMAFTQLGVGSFLTVHLVDEAGFGIGLAAALYAIAQLTGAACRIGVGVVSDRLGRRVPVLRAAAAAAAALVLATLVTPSSRVDGVLLIATLIIVTSWQGVGVATAAGLAPRGRTGATLGMQTTLNAAACTAAPIALGVVLEHHGWRALESIIVISLALAALSFWRLGLRSNQP